MHGRRAKIRWFTVLIALPLISTRVGGGSPAVQGTKDKAGLGTKQPKRPSKTAEQNAPLATHAHRNQASPPYWNARPLRG